MSINENTDKYCHIPLDNALEWSDRSILQPVDKIIQQLSHLRDFELAVAGNIYNLWRVKEKGAPYERGWGTPREPERIWRDVACAPRQNGHRTNQISGYWVYLATSGVAYP